MTARTKRLAGAFALLFAGCADEFAGLPPSRSVRECTASREAVDAYVFRISGLVSNHMRTDVLVRRETVYVSFELAADGRASDFRVVSAKRPEAGQEVLRAAQAAMPYPRPPFDPQACLRGARATISIIGHTRCDEARANEYTQAVATRIQDAVNAAGVTAPEHEKVALRIKVDRQGAASSVTVHDAKSAEAAGRVAEIARKIAPYEAPGDSIAECVADLPFFVWIELLGSTRPPTLIRDP
jgi:hypothetical protein